MNWLNFDLRKLIITVGIILLPLISINTQRKPQDGTWHTKPFSFIGGLFQLGFFKFSSGVQETTSLYLDLINIKKESAAVHAINQELQARLQYLEELKKENDRLNQLLSFRERHKMEVIAARVMGKDLISDHSTLQIDKGTQHGLKSGQAVITTEGVVGHIFRPEALTSQVLLITDRYSVVDGIVSRTRARGIVEGRSQSSGQLRYVEKSEDVQKGDLVITSGLDNIFPKGFPVAIVEFVEAKPYSVSLRVDLKPVVDPDKVEDVFIIVNANQLDLTPQKEAVAGSL